MEGKLLNRFDTVWQQEGYQNRSEALRAATRNFVEHYEIIDHEDDKTTEIVIIFSYDDSKSVRDKLNQVKHQFTKMIKETLHRHIFEEQCFELLTLRGILYEINPVVTKLKSIRGIKSFHSFAFYLEDAENTKSTKKIKR